MFTNHGQADLKDNRVVLLRNIITEIQYPMNSLNVK
jgi:hypothetical protein